MKILHLPPFRQSLYLVNGRTDREVQRAVKESKVQVSVEAPN